MAKSRAEYQREYRKRPGKAEIHRKAVKAYEKRNPEKRKKWVRNWKIHVGLMVPELKELRRAIKRLDQSIQAASQRKGIRKSSESSSDSDT